MATVFHVHGARSRVPSVKDRSCSTHAPSALVLTVVRQFLFTFEKGESRKIKAKKKSSRAQGTRAANFLDQPLCNEMSGIVCPENVASNGRSIFGEKWERAMMRFLCDSAQQPIFTVGIVTRVFSIPWEFPIDPSSGSAGRPAGRIVCTRRVNVISPLEFPIHPVTRLCSPSCFARSVLGVNGVRTDGQR